MKKVLWHRRGSAVQVPGLGWCVHRHGAPSSEYFVADLSTKGEAIKVLYGLAAGWSSVHVTFRDGRTVQLRLRGSVVPMNVRVETDDDL